MTEPYCAIAETIGRDGFAFVRAPQMHALLEAAGLRDWDSFAASWDDLGLDAYMADGGRTPSRVDGDSADVPDTVRPNDRGRAPACRLACRNSSISHRGTARRRGPADTGRNAPRWRRLGLGADG